MKLLLVFPFLFVINGKLSIIDEFDHIIQARLVSPSVAIGVRPPLGMSRVAFPQSYGTHFSPILSNNSDFVPQNDHEKDIIAQLESENLELGLFLFGEAVMDRPAIHRDFRAMKGPAAITTGTRRSGLPSWNAAYPVAMKAMKNFQDGGHGFETELDGWTIAARPAIAKSERCVGCHNMQRGASKKPLHLGDAVGGVLYAYKTPKEATQETADEAPVPNLLERIQTGLEHF